VVAVDEAEIVRRSAPRAQGAPWSRRPRRRRRARAAPRERRHPADETTVLVLTGSGLKASATIGELLKLGARLG
jgi:hypothetical protein